MENISSFMICHIRSFFLHRAAWFEFIYYLLQSPQLLEIVEPHKSQVISVSFQNIDESDPLVAPHVWGCILLIQTNFKDW